MSDRVRHIYDESERRLAETMQEIHERGDIRHLHGKPLKLEDDTPDALVALALKAEGFSHPSLERRQEVEEELRGADALIDHLRLCREDLLSRKDTLAAAAAVGFNDGRWFTLENYRERLVEANRSIRDYNLTVPDPLHVLPVLVDRRMDRIEAAVPALDPADFPETIRERGWRARLKGYWVRR